MPRKRRVHPRDPILVEVLASLGAGHITAAPLDDQNEEGLTVMGICEQHQRPHVTIDEAQHIVPTLIHELVHRVRPAMTELGVERKTRQILRQLSDREINRIYEVYLGRVKRRKAG